MGATDIEDRKGFTRRKNHDSADWSFSSGAHQGIAEAAPAKRSPICSGLNGIELLMSFGFCEPVRPAAQKSLITPRGREALIRLLISVSGYARMCLGCMNESGPALDSSLRSRPAEFPCPDIQHDANQSSRRSSLRQQRSTQCQRHLQQDCN